MWRLALARADTSTIEYRGDSLSGGYDVCCHFIAHSRCELRARDEAVAELARLRAAASAVAWDAAVAPGAAAAEDAAGPAASASMAAPAAAAVDVSAHGTTQQLGWEAERDAHYARHDCPLPAGAFNVSISKPLHRKQAGRWSAILLIAPAATADAAEPPPTVCLAMAFDVRFARRPPIAAPPATRTAARLGSEEGGGAMAGGTTAEDAPAVDARGRRSAPHFEQVSSGRWCRDGADLLEGPLDSYTDCDPSTGLCQLTRQCRARCLKRAACRFYTTYASGRCQLSSVCRDEAAARDASARTFAKRP